MRTRGEPVTIGWTESVDIPEWGIRGLRAKVDTGARSSALHVENIREGPRNRVSFEVVLHRMHRDRRVRVRTRVVRRGRVRSSNGVTSTRLFVETTLLLGPVERRIEVSLVDRGKMIHRMLLGRKALAGLLIDVSHRNLQAPKRKRRKKKTRGRPPTEAGRDGR